MGLAIADTRPAESPGRQRWLGWGLIALGIGVVVNAVLGPLVTDRIDYPVSETMRNQTIGLDAAALLVVAPLAVVVGVLALRGHRASPILALGPTSYGAYIMVQYIAGPDHLAYPNVLILQLAIFTGSWLLAAGAWRRARHPDPPEGLGRWHGYVAWALCGFVALRYVPGLASSVSNEPLPPEAAGDPAMYWLIVLLDLGIFVPIAALTATGLIRNRPWAPSLHRGLVGWFTLVTVAVAAMSVAMNVNDDRYASPAQLVLFVVVGILIGAYAVFIHGPLLARPSASIGGIDAESLETSGSPPGPPLGA